MLTPALPSRRDTLRVVACSGLEASSRLRVGTDPEVWGELATPLLDNDASSAAAGEVQPDSERVTALSSLLSTEAGGSRGWWPTELPTPDRVALVRRLLLQARRIFPAEPDFCLALVDLEARRPGGIKAARKLCRSLLKESVNRNNLQLFDRFAALEVEAGRRSDARKVLYTALDLSASLPAAQRRHAAALALHWCQLETAEGRPEVARALLLSFAVGARPPPPAADSAVEADITPPMRAKGNRAFDQLLQERMDDRAAEALPELVSCAASFAQLTSGDGGLSSGSAVFERVLDWADTLPALPESAVAAEDAYVFYRHSLGHERVFGAYLSMIQRHPADGHRAAQKARKLRQVVLRALEAFPANPGFLTVFLAGEVRGSIAGRVRNYFSKALRRPGAAVTEWIFALLWEALSRRPSAEHRLRALFERCVETPVRHCPLIWRMFMSFEREQRGLDGMGEAQKVFYRALQACPGAKVLYMDTVRHNPRGLQEVLDVLQEKELHMRAPLEEVELILEERDRAKLEAEERYRAALLRQQAHQVLGPAPVTAPRGDVAAAAHAGDGPPESSPGEPSRAELPSSAAATAPFEASRDGDASTSRDQAAGSRSRAAAVSRPAPRAKSLADAVVAAYDELPDYEDE